MNVEHLWIYVLALLLAVNLLVNWWSNRHNETFEYSYNSLCAACVGLVANTFVDWGVWMHVIPLACAVFLVLCIFRYRIT